MNKPSKHTIEYYDYSEVSEFLQKKYNYSERDYSGHFDAYQAISPKVLAKHGITGDIPHGLPDEYIIKIDNEIEAACPPYRDFWHFVVDRGDISNGSIFTMSEEWFDAVEDWQREIGMRYLDEFGEGEPGERCIRFCAEW